MNKSIGYYVDAILNAQIEARGQNWLLQLGYGPSNDYAAQVTAQITCDTGRHTRFETVARYIRLRKESIRAVQAAEKLAAQNNTF